MDGTPSCVLLDLRRLGVLFGESAAGGAGWVRMLSFWELLDRRRVRFGATSSADGGVGKLGVPLLRSSVAVSWFITLSRSEIT